MVVPSRERQDMIRRFHDSLFSGHLGRFTYDVRSYIVSLSTKDSYGTCGCGAPLG